jgi:hypothetical protein
MIKFEEKYQINNGKESIIFSQGKESSVIGKYDSGTLTGKLEGNVLKGTYHNHKNNIAGLIEITFHKNGFKAKWKEGLEPGPMRGKWNASLGFNTPSEVKHDGQNRKVGIYTAQYDEEEGELIPLFAKEEKPYLIAIGFFDSHLVGTFDEWYGFVGYVITNTCDKVRTESVLFMDETGQTVEAHDMGGEAISNDGNDILASFKEMYPAEWAQIEKLLYEYFYCTEEEQENDTLYYSIKKDIPEALQLTNLFTGDTLDLEDIKKNNGSRLCLMIDL